MNNIIQYGAERLSRQILYNRCNQHTPRAPTVKRKNYDVIKIHSVLVVENV